MEIKYYGNTSFFIKGKKTTVALDPKSGMPEADLSIFSSDEHDNNTSKQVIDWPGEYEVVDILVHGIASQFGEKEINLFNFEIDNIRFLYLPNLDHVLEGGDLEKLGSIDIVLLPVGANGVLDAKTATKVYESIDPKVVLPMQHSHDGFAPVTDFLKEVGQAILEEEASLNIEKLTLPMDSTSFHLLAVS